MPEAFTHAALGLLSLLVDPATVVAAVERNVLLHADDAGHLLVRWLSEVLYLFDGEKFVMKRCHIDEWSGTKLRATLRGEAWNPDRHVPRMDVKAVTYHHLEVQERPGACRVRATFDI
jgi:SHS2 domain-containing protein